MNSRLVTALFVLVFFTSLAMNAQEHTRFGDDQIRMMIEHELSEEVIEGVQVGVSRAVVTLEGKVRSVWAKEHAVEIALGIHDVQEVVDELSIAQAESDEDLVNAIRDRVLHYVFYTIFDDIEMLVENGVVTLRGRVTMPYKSEEIARLVSKELGVQEVKNEIRALPVSSFDDQLRNSIAARIYRELPEYATRSNPPIHIIVENGHVTLTGVVRSEVERRRAETIARSAFGVFSVENRLRVDSSSWANRSQVTC